MTDECKGPGPEPEPIPPQFLLSPEMRNVFGRHHHLLTGLGISSPTRWYRPATRLQDFPPTGALLAALKPSHERACLQQRFLHTGADYGVIPAEQQAQQ